MSVLLGGVYSLWTVSEKSGKKLSTSGVQMQEIRLGVKKMMNELQEGLALYYPHPGGLTQRGVGFLNARGEVIMYYEHLSADETGKAIWRADLNAGTAEELIRDVAWLRTTVLPAARGKEASCVNLDVSLFGQSATGTTTAQYNVVTSVFLRGLQRDVPE